MAILIPDYFDPDADPGSQDIFGRLRHSQDMSSWMCFHSLSMMRQRHRRETDPDFVLLGPRGILVLKIKEGHLRIGSDGGWLQLNRRVSPRPVRITHGPFKETSAAMYALKGAMTHAFGAEIEKVNFGYGVMFPDMPVFETASREWDPEIVYQGVDRLSPIHLYVERLAAYWQKSRSGKSALTQPTIDKYENFLRANFEVAPPMNAVLTADSADFVWFTGEQCRALDLMAENDRAVIGGAAGTGKTFLALELARRLASRGKRTLLLCQSSLLGDFLNRVAAQPVYKGMLEANSVLNYLMATIKASSLYSEFQTESRKTGNTGVHFQFFLKAVNETGVAKYDSIIIDQGNDVLSGDALFALDYTLRGGFECGSWYVFYDDSTKADEGQVFTNDVLTHLQSFMPVDYHLTLNCRSTKSIAAQTALTTGFPLVQGGAEGETVKIRWYYDPEEQLSDLKKVVAVLLAEGMKPEELTIVYPGGQLYLREGLNAVKLRAPLVELGSDCHFPPEPGKIGFASIQAFRGLENKVIIVLGIDKIGEPWADALAYFGMTRARSLLMLFMNRRLKNSYEELRRKHAEVV